MKKDTVLPEYHYELPVELIARVPAEPRDSSRLFVYDTQKDSVSYDTFADLANYLPPESLIVLNDTQVVPARVNLSKGRGGSVEVLFLVNEWVGDDITGMVNKWVHKGEKLSFPSGEQLEAVEQNEHLFSFRLLFNESALLELLYRFGTTPIPKYIGKPVLGEDVLRERYQTIFSKNPSSIAAPTASLHFTESVFEKLGKKQIDSTYITLNVGLGTFAPVLQENLKTGKLHTEYYDIPERSAQLIQRAKREGRKIITAGTTVMRATESASSSVLSGKAAKGSTDIFIKPPFPFRIADGLITNFHLPGTSLLMLVDAFLKHKGARRNILELYSLAIQERFRFYSFGDAMLIL